MKVLALLGVLCLVALSWAAKGKNWAVLVAGSNTYGNYRHQADVCHAYQILKAHGIPDERIVVMMYDDIANNPSNPDQGKIINKPGGPNVYPGVPKDYVKDEDKNLGLLNDHLQAKRRLDLKMYHRTGLTTEIVIPVDVTPEIFLKVLQGEKTGTGSGKTIKSGPNDNIFVNLVDHGAPGIFAFPSEVLNVKDLNDALKSMHKKKKFNQLAFYMESCESGSMFYQDLPKNINVFATTASNPTESSWACYWDAHVEAYLGDVYSVKWMEDSDKEDLSVETLLKQFKVVKKETTTSHVQKYGDMKLGSDVLDDFQGTSNGTGRIFDPTPAVPITDAVPSEDVFLHVLEKKIWDTERYTNNEIQGIIAERDALLATRKRNLAVIETIASMSGSNRLNAKEYFLNSRLHLTQHACYKTAVKEFNRICFGGNLTQDPFAMRKMYVLINMCENRVPITNMIDGMTHACAQ